MGKVKKVKDEPRYKVIYGYEDDFKQKQKKVLKGMTSALQKKVKQIYNS